MIAMIIVAVKRIKRGPIHTSIKSDHTKCVTKGRLLWHLRIVQVRESPSAASWRAFSLPALDL